MTGLRVAAEGPLLRRAFDLLRHAVRRLGVRVADPAPAARSTRFRLADVDLPFTQRLDDAIRQWDRRLNRTRGGWLDRCCGIDRHTLAALLLPALLCALLVLGSPSAARLLFAGLTGLLTAVVLAGAMRWSAKRASPLGVDVAMQVAVVLCVAGAILAFGSDQSGPVFPYRHLFIPLACAVALALAVGAWRIGPMFGWLRDNSRYGQYLRRTELFASRGKPAPRAWARILVAALTFVVVSPLALLTLPALAVLLSPPTLVRTAGVVSAAASLFALLVSGANERFAVMWVMLQNVLFRGGALLISIAVIALAAMRLVDNTYVTTVFDSAAWYTIVAVLASAYVLCWWFDYWSHRLLLDQVLQLLDAGAGGRAAIDYPLDPAAKATSVPATRRSLEVHGSTRLLAYNPTGERAPYFQGLRPMELIQLLATSGAPGGKAHPTPGQIASRIADYYVVVAAIFLAPVIAVAWWLHGGVQDPAVRLQQAHRGLALRDLLQSGADRELIVIAASGGGTRAAVYTAAVLEGLAQRGRIGDVVLGSGVSGGGAALAYFAGHRPSLIAGDAAAWQLYFDKMSEPYIQDVLEHASEWRMVGHGRLGMALAESFADRWQLPESRRQVTAIRDLGLIFNTALAGHFDRPASAPTGKPLYAVEPAFRASHTSSALSGGRLLLTNLDLQSMVGAPLEPDPQLARLPVAIRSEGLRLEQAAALNANFPPVFSNAAVDVDETSRYWVTDGGAVDNRGLEMLLFAIRSELGRIAPARLPRLHVVVADASAFSHTYTQDRGLSTVVGAGTRYASLLNNELVQSICARYGNDADSRFRVSYVTMPDLLRESGSFGTHWMLQPWIQVKIREGEKVHELTLVGSEMVKVIRALHTPALQRDLGPDGQTVLRWSMQDPGHHKGWTDLVGGTSDGRRTGDCSARQ